MNATMLRAFWTFRADVNRCQLNVAVFLERDVLVDQEAHHRAHVIVIARIDDDRKENVVAPPDRELVGERIVEFGFVVQRIGSITDEATDGSECAREHGMSAVRLHLELVPSCDQRGQVAKAIRSLARGPRTDGAYDFLAHFLELIGKPVPCSLAGGSVV
jgi:hypothetical protein